MMDCIQKDLFIFLKTFCLRGIPNDSGTSIKDMGDMEL